MITMIRPEDLGEEFYIENGKIKIDFSKIDLTKNMETKFIPLDADEESKIAYFPIFHPKDGKSYLMKWSSTGQFFDP